MTTCQIRLQEGECERQIEVRANEILRIGRVPSREEPPHLVLEFEDVSLKHAEIHCSEFACTIVDIGSLFGTWVNEKRLNKGRHCPIHTGDVVKIGSHELTILQCPQKEMDGIHTQSVRRTHLPPIHKEGENP